MAMTQNSVTRTSGTALRDMLRKYEIGVANPKGRGETALETFRIRDQIEEAVAKLQADNVDIRAELTRLSTADAGLQASANKFNKELKASGGLAAVRATENPPPEKWWWYIDSTLASQKKRRFTSIGITVGVLAVIIIGGLYLVDRFAGPPANVREALKHTTKAEGYLQQKDYDAAILEYETAATLTPPESRITPTAVVEGTPQKFTYGYANADPQVYLAALYTIKGRTAEATSMEKAAERIMGNREFVLESVAQAFFNMNEIDYASAKVAELLEQNPENARGYYIRGSIYEVQGEFQDALADFKLSGELAQNQFNASLFAMAQTRYVNLLQRLPNEAPTDSQ